MLDRDLSALIIHRICRPLSEMLNMGVVQGRVLLYGCGDGRDADKLMIDKHDPRSFPCKGETQYDVILCVEYLDSVTDYKATIQDMCSMLVRGGCIYYSTKRGLRVDGAFELEVPGGDFEIFRIANLSSC